MATLLDPVCSSLTRSGGWVGVYSNPTRSVCWGESIVRLLRQQGTFLRDLITDKLLVSRNPVDVHNLLALTNDPITI